MLAESLVGSKGTRACMVVPRWACETIESCPSTNFKRSSMLVNPSPASLISSFASKPFPESLTIRSILPGGLRNCTSLILRRYALRHCALPPGIMRNQVRKSICVLLRIPSVHSVAHPVIVTERLVS
jgi:hypothetical protein